jgi:hypothetical protein
MLMNITFRRRIYLLPPRELLLLDLAPELDDREGAE